MHIRTTLRSVHVTYFETKETLTWVWNTILSEYGRQKVVISITLLLIALTISMADTYIAKEVIDCISAGDRERALILTLIGVGGLMIVARLLTSVHEFTRELGWNNNYLSVISNLTQLFFSRTAGEMLNESNEVGAEQVESAKDRIQNILYMVLFECPVVVLGLLTATAFMFTIDMFAGIGMIVLVAGNVIWFLYCNALIDSKMESVDRGLRRANRRMIERWNFALSTKTSGVEDKIHHHIVEETKTPLDADKRIWAYWFIPLDFVRGSINVTTMTTVLSYGILYGNWSGGDFAAIFFWFTMAIDRFGYLGHLMRHLTSQVVRIKAVRTVLESQPKFRYDEGIVYTPHRGGTREYSI